jgi:hypothetical protein
LRERNQNQQVPSEAAIPSSTVAAYAKAPSKQRIPSNRIVLPTNLSRGSACVVDCSKDRGEETKAIVMDKTTKLDPSWV